MRIEAEGSKEAGQDEKPDENEKPDKPDENEKPDKPDENEKPDKPDENEKPDKKAEKPPTKRELILSGGGTNGLAMLGALHTLQQHGRLSRVRRVVGTSVGGIIALLLVAGYHAIEIYRVLEGIGFAFFDEIDCDSVLMFYDTLGAVDGAPFVRLVRVMLEKKGVAADATFAQLHARSGVALGLTGYNVLTSSTECFSHSSHPTMPVLKAARITMSIPLYFRPVEYAGGLYVDGGLVEPTPVRFCRNKAESIVVALTCNAYSDSPTTPPLPLQMADFVPLLLRGPGRCLHHRCLRLERMYPQSVVNIQITCPDGKSRFMDLEMGVAEKRRLFELGVAGVRSFLAAREALDTTV